MENHFVWQEANINNLRYLLEYGIKTEKINNLTPVRMKASKTKNKQKMHHLGWIELRNHHKTSIF